MSKVVEAAAKGIMAVFTHSDFAASNLCLPTHFDLQFFTLVACLNILRSQ